MKEEQWLKKIKERLDDYSEEIPSDGWQRLEKALGEVGATPFRQEEKRAKVIPLRRWLAVAASVTLVVAGSLSLWLLNGPADERMRLAQTPVELTEEIQELQNRSDKLYIYRAFSAIADLRSLEADLVRARLYFALQQYDEAVETLRNSAGSLRAKLTADREMANALQIVEKAYETDTVFYETQEFRDAVTSSAPFSCGAANFHASLVCRQMSPCGNMFDKSMIFKYLDIVLITKRRMP